MEACIELLRRVEEGVFDGLECPVRRANAVSAWFTNAAPGKYRTWLICGRCDFRESAGGTRPLAFRPDRVHPELQVLDEELAKNAHFPDDPDDERGVD